MQWVNVAVDILHRPEFTASEPAEIGIWLRLACYCAAQENGGVVRNCRTWTDRQWLIAAGVTMADLKTKTELWEWDKVGGLSIAHYPLEKEREVIAKRKAGQATAKRRWGRKLAGNRNHAKESAE